MLNFKGSAINEFNEEDYLLDSAEQLQFEYNNKNVFDYLSFQDWIRKLDRLSAEMKLFIIGLYEKNSENI
jgi:hypothetical protein